MLVREGTDGDYAMDTGETPDWGSHIADWARDGEYDPLSRWLEAVEALGMIYLEQRRSTDCIELFTTVLTQTHAPDIASFGDEASEDEPQLPPQVAAAWFHRASCYMLQDMRDLARVGALTACVTGDPPVRGACELAEELR